MFHVLKPSGAMKENVLHTISYVFALSICTLILVITYKSGIGVSPDSTAYIVAARDLHEGQFFVDYVAWPPLYPLVLGIINFAGIDPIIGAKLLNSLIAAGIILIGSRLIINLRINFFAKFIGIVLLAVNYPLLFVHTHLWTESLFILLGLVFFSFLQTFLNQKSLQSVVVLSVITTLLTLTRYVGVLYGVMGILGILVSALSLRKKLWYGFVYVVSSLFLPVLWIARNTYLYGSARGEFGESFTSVYQSFRGTVKVLIGWLFPTIEVYKYQVGILLLLIAIAVFTFKIYKNHRTLISYVRTNYQSSAHIVLLIVYISYLILYASRVPVDPIDNRLLSPMYFSLLLLYLQFIHIIASFRWVPLKVFVYLVLLFQAVTLTQVFVQYSQYLLITNNNRYAVPQWTESATIQWLRENGNPQYSYISNNKFPIRVLTRIRPDFTPRKTYYNSPTPTQDITLLYEAVRQGGKVFLVHFDNTDLAHDYYSLHELSTMFTVQLVAQLTDGAIYSITEKNTVRL